MPVSRARAAVYEYAVQGKQGLIALEITQEPAGQPRIRVWTKFAAGASVPNFPLLRGLFVVPEKAFHLQKEVLPGPAGKAVFFEKESVGYQQEIRSDSVYTRIVTLARGRVQSRRLLEPRHPAFDLAELFMPPAKTGSSVHESCYLMAGDTFETVRIDRQPSRTAVHNDAGLLLADFSFNGGANATADRVVFTDAAGAAENTCRLTLRYVRTDGTPIGRRHLALSPEIFAAFLEARDQQHLDHPRAFSRGRDGFLLETKHAHAVDITAFVNRTLKEKLTRSGILRHSGAFSRITFALDKTRDRVLPVIEPAASLAFDRQSPEIDALRGKARSRHRNTVFDTDIGWSIENGKTLKGELGFTYDQEIDKSENVNLENDAARRIGRPGGRKPEYYRYRFAGKQIEATAYYKRFYLFETRLGSTLLSPDHYWDRLVQRLRSRKLRFDRKLGTRVDKRSGRLTLRYRLLQQRRTAETARIDLARAYEQRLRLVPDNYRLETPSGRARIYGGIDPVPANTIAMKTLRDANAAHFPEHAHTRKTTWDVVPGQDRIFLQRDLDLSIPIPPQTIERLVAGQFDILEMIGTEMVSAQALRCDFWGFEIKKTSSD